MVEEVKEALTLNSDYPELLQEFEKQYNYEKEIYQKDHKLQSFSEYELEQFEKINYFLHYYYW